ncbi:DED1 [Hepatospora eriocheir]|uniref:RNA helicase n=1 Tax=Hepatospora eriocheir TaxID=1081669 RepID=A0A1X0QDH6_9MICR|nr:DED1 [Hepatospora eriocheir]
MKQQSNKDKVNSTDIFKSSKKQYKSNITDINFDEFLLDPSEIKNNSAIFKEYTEKLKSSENKNIDESKSIEANELIETNSKYEPIKDFKKFSFMKQNGFLNQVERLPTIIQQYAIPVILKGENIVVKAPTGMGKTLCFAIPIIEMFKTSNYKSLIISPSRELAEQTFNEFQNLIKNTDKFNKIKACTVCGGKTELDNYDKFDILVATPGRLLDLLERKKILLDDLKCFVLDEADKLLDMGFEKPIMKVVSYFNSKEVQKILASATYPTSIKNLIDRLFDSNKISVVMKETQKEIKQEFKFFKGFNEKYNFLINFLNNECTFKGSWAKHTLPDKVLVFVETKKHCEELFNKLKTTNLLIDCIHGDKDQFRRNKAIGSFKTDRTNILIATSVLSRGIDVKDINYVINFDFPKEINEYVHRIGRTGRMGKKGVAINLININNDKLDLNDQLLNDLINFLKTSSNEIPSELLNKNKFKSKNKLKIKKDNLYEKKKSDGEEDKLSYEEKKTDDVEEELVQW